ncbi:hypothetical protein [Haloarcula salinisoli]|uniref:Uncharacterized protein n=1 Tax=Haloarcula salinisoli TaxID=2487746 RepID=A0A8J7YLC4_9EURY|nr:hypothetical protein [Halomicroarcula salinisoli]MBX0287568.1 hypothetical protein [Halomicroarcula salinisoli]MBX0304864.1 hypothetical protein [Halomicroarcula salinisoli]
MSDDISLFHPRMRKPAIYAAVFGLILGFLAIKGQRIATGGGQPWVLVAPYAILSAAFLYGIMYRNLSQHLSQEE